MGPHCQPSRKQKGRHTISRYCGAAHSSFSGATLSDPGPPPSGEASFTDLLVLAGTFSLEKNKLVNFISGGKCEMKVNWESHIMDSCPAFGVARGSSCLLAAHTAALEGRGQVSRESQGRGLVLGASGPQACVTSFCAVGRCRGRSQPAAKVPGALTDMERRPQTVMAPEVCLEWAKGNYLGHSFSMEMLISRWP